jgi:hypothetical protein
VVCGKSKEVGENEMGCEVMDKDKLIKRIKQLSVYYFNNVSVVNSSILIDEIQNGEFDKEPCEHCNSGHYRDLKGGSYSVDLYQYCPNCGRKLEVAK